MENETSYTPEQIADKLQLLGILPGPQKPFVAYLTANSGLVTSLGDLINKLDNGTATSNDYIDVVKDIGATVVGVALLAELVGITLLSAPAILGIGVGLAVLDYIDEHHYSSDEMLHDITSIKDGILNWLKEFDLAEDILPDFSSNIGQNENFSSPLVLDLNANGTTSTFIAQSETYFDMDGDGFKERTSWTESTDGLLALDKNQDNIINNGSELFGNYTKLSNGTLAKNGFEALSQYDLNKDNIIDNKDSIYTHLKVWGDTNSDGISTTDELKTLQELNISQINLASTKTIFTCKPFKTQKALHVKTNIEPKEEDNGLYQKVA